MKSVAFCIISLIFILSHFSGMSVYAEEIEGPNGNEQNYWVQKFYSQMFAYSRENLDLKQVSPSQIYLSVWGKKVPLNSQFYELMKTSLYSVSDGYNDFCERCVVENIQDLSQDKKFVETIENKINSLADFNASIKSVKNEFGYMALIGYVVMEMLEHSILGPLGVCPILNAVYFSSLDTFKTMGHVFKYSKDFKVIPLPSLMKSIKAGIRMALLKKRASKIILEFDPVSRIVCETSTHSEVHYSHMKKKFSKSIIWQKEDIGQYTITYGGYKKYSRMQKRLRWFTWNTELQGLFVHRLMWPIAYQELVLNPYLKNIIGSTNPPTFSEGHAGLEVDNPVGDWNEIENNFHNSSKATISNDLAKDLEVIFNSEESPHVRLYTAVIINEYFYLIKREMLFFARSDLESRVINKHLYAKFRILISEISILQAEFSNYLITGSLSKNKKRLHLGYLRTKNSLEKFMELSEIVENWRVSGIHASKDRTEILRRLEVWSQEIIDSKPWRKHKKSLIQKVKSCMFWLNK